MVLAIWTSYRSDFDCAVGSTCPACKDLPVYGAVLCPLSVRGDSRILRGIGITDQTYAGKTLSYYMVGGCTDRMCNHRFCTGNDPRQKTSAQRSTQTSALLKKLAPFYNYSNFLLHKIKVICHASLPLPPGRRNRKTMSR